MLPVTGKFKGFKFDHFTRFYLKLAAKLNCFSFNFLTLHSGSSLDINFFSFFFVSYVSLNLSDDVFLGKNVIFPIK
jgi:hypothetical protein